jgi:redox-sensitive bicupin YhaK (pirin superfamily)
MLTIRRDKEIWHEPGEWFDARWHFSFDHYRDPANDGFGAMRVFNDDRLIPGAIWPLHPHRDVEGITYVVEGSFRHQDNVGGAPGPLPAGSVQRMTLGSGAWHSEQNASKTEGLRFIQIWILPNAPDLPPEVEQVVLTAEDRTNRLLRVVAPEGSADGHSVSVHQDASVYVGRLEPGVALDQSIAAGHGLYLYVIEGIVRLDGQPVSTGDAANIESAPQVRIEADEQAELIAVEVPMAFERVGIWAGRAD